MRCVVYFEGVLSLVGGGLVGCLAGVLLSMLSFWSECGMFVVSFGLLLLGGDFVFV